MKKTTTIYLSHQAKLLMDKMPEVKEEELVDWFCEIRKISIGGADLVEFLNYKLEAKKND